MPKSCYVLLIALLFTALTPATRLHGQCGTPSAVLRINGWSLSGDTYVTVCPNTPIIADGSGSSCAQKYLLSIELADRQWNRKGGEFWQWLGNAEYGKYGVIGGFDVKKWAEDHYFQFVPGQYYRVKLAIGPWWREAVKLIYVDSTPKSVPLINNSSSAVVDISSPYAIVLNGSASTCTTSYFVSIELSDQSWNRKGGEYGEWLDAADFARYGGISSFNVKKWAEDHHFHFSAGQYYRVKLALGPVWTEKLVLIHIV